MTNRWMRIGVLTLAGLLAGTLAQAADQAPPKTEAAQFDAGQLADFSREVGMLSQLVTFGENNKDALILISAVRLLDSLPFKGVAKPGTDEKANALYDRTEMLKQAKEFAGEDKEVLAVIAKLESMPEMTEVRHGHHHHHGGWHGGWHGGHHGGYHGRGYWYPAPRPCVWVQRCGPWGCEWICR